MALLINYKGETKMSAQKSIAVTSYDMIAQVSETAANKLAAACYQVNIFPRDVEGSFDAEDLEIDVPIEFIGYLSFDYRLHFDEPTIDFRPTAPPKAAKYDNGIKFQTAARIEITAIGGRTITLDIDLYAVAAPSLYEDYVHLHLRDIEIAGLSVSNEQVSQEFLEFLNIVLDALVRLCFTKFPGIPLSPCIFSSTLADEALTVHLDGIKVMRDALAVCSNVNGGDGEIDIVGDFTGGKDLAIGFSSDLIDRIFHICWEKRIIPRKYDSIKIKELKFGLRDGRVKVEGKAECKPLGIRIKFSFKAYGALYYDQKTGELEVDVQDVDVSTGVDLFLSSIGSLISLFLGAIIGFLVGQILERVLEHNLDYVLDFSLNLPFFRSDVPGSNLQVRIGMNDIKVTRAELILRGNMEVYLYVGNSNPNSMEIHKTECHWVDKILDTHKVRFASIDDAVSHGYNGCYYCLPEHHTK